MPRATCWQHWRCKTCVFKGAVRKKSTAWHDGETLHMQEPQPGQGYLTQHSGAGSQVLEWYLSVPIQSTDCSSNEHPEDSDWY